MPRTALAAENDSPGGFLRSNTAWSPLILGQVVILFAFSTNQYGKRSWAYWVEKQTLKASQVLYVLFVLFVLFVFIGAVVNLQSVLDFGDMMTP